MSKPRAGIYTRVSTSHQKEQGDSLPIQEKRLRAYCEAQGFEVTQVYIDAGISAKDTNRPQLQALLSDCADKLFDTAKNPAGTHDQ